MTLPGLQNSLLAIYLKFFFVTRIPKWTYKLSASHEFTARLTYQITLWGKLILIFKYDLLITVLINFESINWRYLGIIL